MRRRYSTFAIGLPGIGLLIMRLVAGGLLIYGGIAGLTGQLTIGLPTPVLLAKIVLGGVLFRRLSSKQVAHG